jgi:predicted alpha/beta hydrolase
MKKESLIVKSWTDGFPLAATVFEPDEEKMHEETVVVVVSSATGLAQTFYAKFARYSSDVAESNRSWLAIQGIPVVTYDYRYTVWPP